MGISRVWNAIRATNSNQPYLNITLSPPKYVTLLIHIYFFKDLLVYLKGSVTGRNVGEIKIEKDLPTTVSFPKWPQWPWLAQAKANGYFQVSYVASGAYSI